MLVTLGYPTRVRIVLPLKRLDVLLHPLPPLLLLLHRQAELVHEQQDGQGPRC